MRRRRSIKLRYLEQIGQPCEVSLGGTLTAESERDVLSSKITAIDISGDDAVVHIRGTSGARDLGCTAAEATG